MYSYRAYIKVLFLVIVLCLSGCSAPNTDSNPGISSAPEETEHSAPVQSYTPTPRISFTNKYGTSTTKCVQSGCNNYIATSGDTNCCVTHSSNCLECGCYIDGDAMYCMSCLEKAIDDISSYEQNVDDVAGIYETSPEDVDAQIQAVIDAMYGG